MPSVKKLQARRHIPSNTPKAKRKLSGVDSTLSSRPSILLALSWYSMGLHKGIARYAKQANWILDASMTRSLIAPVNWQGDGIISQLYGNTNLFRFIAKQKCPVVNIGDVKIPGIPTVRSDHVKLGQAAARHFLKRGFKHVAFCSRSNRKLASVQLRGLSLKKSIEAAGAKCYGLYWKGSYNYGDTNYNKAQFLAWLGQHIAQLPKPLAILAEHDEVGIEVMQACIQQGIRIPEDVAILGIDNDTLRCEFAPVALSSIDSNQEMEGYEAAAHLDLLLKGEPVQEEPILVPPRGLIKRQSTDIINIKHPHVRAVLKHIWADYSQPINAKSIATKVPISYRCLHDAFQRHVGHTMAEEITCQRLKKAKHLLVESDMRMYEISSACGFTDDTIFGVVFKKEAGMTPAQYRQANRVD